MGKHYGNENMLDGERVSNVYVPRWAQTLIDLYASPLRYEVMYEMRGKGVTF